MTPAHRQPIGWSPSPARQRWSSFQTSLAGGYPSSEPMPVERVRELFDELLSIARQMADEHDAIFEVLTELRGPWIVVKHDLNRLTAMFGTGLATTATSDPALLEPHVRRRVDELAGSESEAPDR